MWAALQGKAKLITNIFKVKSKSYFQRVWKKKIDLRLLKKIKAKF
jgi:hypothetical protein